MSIVKEPIISDETGKAILEALTQTNLVKSNIQKIESVTAVMIEELRSAIPEEFVSLKDKVLSLTSEIDHLHPLSIITFSVSPSLAEKGSTVDSESFSFSVNRSGATLSIDGTVVTGNSATRKDSLTSARTYTLEAILNGVSASKTATINFIAPIYYGISSSYSLTDETVLSLTRVLSSNRGRTFTVTADAGQYILYALPSSLGTPTFKVGGFEGGFTKVGTFNFTNSSGYSESYDLYRSVNANLGNTNVTVS